MYAADGLKQTFKDEQAFRLECLAVVMALPVLYAISASLAEKLLMFLSLMLVLIAELVNTAVEAAIDRISADKHPLAKKAKDVASAAVALSVFTAAVIWLVVIF